MINFGKGRGDIDSSGHIKVLLNDEGIFMKVIAISKNRKKIIGTLANDTFSINNYKWGDLVLAEEKNSKEIPHMIKKVSSVPNTSEWTLIGSKVQNFGGVFG